MKCRDDMLSHGVYIVAAASGKEKRGLAVAWGCQVGIDKLMVFVGDQSTTREFILESGSFGISVLSEKQLDVAKRFGSSASTDTDKFDGIPWHTGKTGSPLLDESPLTLDCRVDAVFDYTDGKMIVGHIIEADEQTGKYVPLLYHNEDY